MQFHYIVGAHRDALGLLIGHMLITMPYVVRTVGAGLVGINPEIEEAAKSLGAARCGRCCG